MGTGETRRILSGTESPRLDLELLAHITDTPELFSNREHSFWADPYVSEHVLNAHVDPDSEVASRTHEDIRATVEFLDAHMHPDGKGGRVLDIGCGPGLYAEKLGERGYTVTGLDISPASLEYATKRNESLGLNNTFRRADFLTAEFGSSFDLAVQVYGEFGTVTPDELRGVLARVHGSLKPGGALVFDVFTKTYVDRVRTGHDWYVSLEDGFWQAEPHMVIEQTFRYEPQRASVARYTVVNEDGTFRQFSVWWISYDAEQIRDLVTECGFTAVELYGSIWGDELREDGEWIAVVARRPLT